ncbi:hypothetical protein [Arthrobacter sp. EpRS71]|uniref:hypothetical protein n=1 Tax=Arthrobacter sp. EpRS71 TaxID=1743141 RepID=UPI000749821D|nr:hypothetical protein [Arthrobacter sp. EpRS71]KUM34524.1 hypothetical protein AR689_10295 [Arthrobacter sp. EpRS71]
MADHRALSTQERNPRSAVLRTVLVAAVALFPLLNGALKVVVEELEPYRVHLPDWLFVALNVAIAVTVALIAIGTRIMAIPGVNEWLRKYVPLFAPEDKGNAEVIEGEIVHDSDGPDHRAEPGG